MIHSYNSAGNRITLTAPYMFVNGVKKHIKSIYFDGKHVFEAVQVPFQRDAEYDPETGGTAMASGGFYSVQQIEGGIRVE